MTWIPGEESEFEISIFCRTNAHLEPIKSLLSDEM